MRKAYYMRFPVFTTESRGHVFSILDPKIPKFTYIKFEVISKPSNTVVLSYFELNIKTYYVDSLVELNKIPPPPEICKNKTQN